MNWVFVAWWVTINSINSTEKPFYYSTKCHPNVEWRVTTNILFWFCACAWKPWISLTPTTKPRERLLIQHEWLYHAFFEIACKSMLCLSSTLTVNSLDIPFLKWNKESKDMKTLRFLLLVIHKNHQCFFLMKIIVVLYFHFFP